MYGEVIELLPKVLAIARAAGDEIMRVYNTEFAVQSKADASPLTEADLAAHHYIMAELEALTPQLPRLSEEGQMPEFATRQSWESYWIIDPLDGTKEFVKRTGEFTVNIALIHAGRPILGVVHAPAIDTSYFAAHGGGAWRQQPDQPLAAIRTARAGQGLRVVASASHRSERDAALLARLPVAEIQGVGSSLKFCRIAEGGADFYPRLGPTSEWDTAAGQCVVEQAGGIVLGPDLQALPYNRKDSILNPHFYVIGDPLYAWKPVLQADHTQAP